MTLGPDVELADASVEAIVDGDSFLQGQCAGLAVSYGPDGEVLDAAVGIGGAGNGALVDVTGDNVGERAFTGSNPFEVRADGQVLYFGRLPYGGSDGARNHIWEITTSAISVDSGGDDNPNGNNANVGVVDLADNIPSIARFTGKFTVQAWLFSENGMFCLGDGTVEFTGPFPLATAAGAVGALFALGGVAGLLFNARPSQTFKV